MSLFSHTSLLVWVWVWNFRLKINFLSEFSFFKINLFIYFWLQWVFVAAQGLSLVAASRGYSPLWCTGFSLRWLLLLRNTGSRHTGFSSCGSQAPEHRLSSCGTRAQLLRDMWDLPGPGLEPVSPALASGFLTTVPPGKPSVRILKALLHNLLAPSVVDAQSEAWMVFLPL